MSLPEKFDIIIPPQNINCEPGLQERLANGDREAFAWVYKNYCKRIYNYALLITNNTTMSEDIVQDVFIKLWQHKEKLCDVKDFNAYIYILYRNLTNDILKADQKEKYAREIFTSAFSNHTDAVADYINYAETKKQLHSAVQQLPRNQQQAFILREKGIKRETIARRMNKSENKVKGYLNRALRFLKEKIQ